METQNIPSNQNNLRKKNRAGGVMLSDFRLQSYSNQNSMVLTKLPPTQGVSAHHVGSHIPTSSKETPSPLRGLSGEDW